VLRLTRTGDLDRGPRRGSLRAILVSLTCLCRSLSLFWHASPRTPLRVLCIVALDIVRVLRSSRPLSHCERHRLATLLDFQACTNAVWDRKPLHVAEYHALRQRLEDVGLAELVATYVSRLEALETRRPIVGGDRHRCGEVRVYRESVVRLSLAVLIATISKAGTVEAALRSTYCERDVATLFQLAMQCQIIDDVLDYRDDLSAGLPSFLTGSASLPEAVTCTARAVRCYATRPRRLSGRSVLPLEAALYIVTAAAKLVVGFVPIVTGVTVQVDAANRRMTIKRPQGERVVTKEP
jgi:hypothetical protein